MARGLSRPDSDPELNPPAIGPGARTGIAIACRGLGFTYGSTALFQGLDLAFRAGITTAILGPSGVGKSSLLRILAGLESPSAGSVQDGDGAPLGQRCAWQGQRDGLFPWLSVIDNAVAGYRLRRDRTGLALALTRAASLLGEVGLSDATQLRPDQLSGGMRQRAALVRTLIEDRPIVLMDEPFSALDALTRLAMQSLCCRLLAGRAVILVTHDPMEALRLGDQVLVMTGSPARMLEPVPLPVRPPGSARDIGDPALIHWQRILLDALGAGAPPC